MDHKLNFAISGCGNIAFRHAAAASNFGNLIAVCDADISKASKLAEQFNCKAYGSLSAMLLAENADVISICTPNYLHAPQSIECLQKGFHVVCEKPMAINMTDAEEMVATSTKTEKELFIVKQLRYYPHLIFIKNIIENGLLGKIYSFHINCFWNRPQDYYRDWKGSKEKDGGTLYTQFSHYIDLVLWFFGNVKQVQFTSSNLAHPNIEFEDTGMINMIMENGSIGGLSYTVNAYEKNVENSITIFAENGTLKLTGQMLDKFEYFNVKDVNQPFDLAAKNHKDQSHFTVYENVVKALNGNNHFALKADESIASIQLIDHIYNLKNF